METLFQEVFDPAGEKMKKDVVDMVAAAGCSSVVEGVVSEPPQGAHPEKVRRAAMRLFEKGAGYKLTARKLGIKASTVRDWARQWRKGTFSVKPAAKVYRITDRFRQTICELRAQGVSWVEISRRTGISRTTCRRIWLDA